MRLSIIIPILNEEAGLPATLANVAACAHGSEVLLTDGGSTDNTLAIIAEFCARQEPAANGMTWRLLHSARGRGRQMNLAAREATGDTLLFLHADTHLPPDAPALIAAALHDPRVLGGNFRIRFTPPSSIANFYTVVYNARTRFQIFYGDSALWVRRDVFEQVGGYPLERVMEDFALVLRLRKTGRLVCLPSVVESSARRFQGAKRNSRALLQWGWLHVLLLCGAGDETLERFYPPVR